MILVDSPIWVDHLRRPNDALRNLLTANRVLMHPFVVGEIAMGSLQGRKTVIGAMLSLPQALVAQDDEVLKLVDRFALGGSGIGYVDAHLLASALLTQGATLLTRDRRLAAVATRLGVAA